MKIPPPSGGNARAEVEIPGVTVCEFQVKSFNARGDDEYLDELAAYLDRMLESGWELIDRERDQCPGWWRVWLYHETRAIRQDSLL